MTLGVQNVDYEHRPYNPERMRTERLARAHAALHRHGLGGIITYNWDTFRYLGYYSSHQYARRRPGNFILLIRDAGFPFVAVDPHAPHWDQPRMPWLEGRMRLETSEQLMNIQAFPGDTSKWIHGHWERTAAEIKGLLDDHGVGDLPVGIDFGALEMIRACERAGIALVDGNPAIVEARIIKTCDEVECLKMASVIAEGAHWEVCRALRPGVTEWEMAGVAAKACFDLGAEELEGPSFVVASGERSGNAVPSMPTDRVVRPGDMFVVDINGVSFQGYRTCFYRTHVVGDKPTRFQREVYKCAHDGLVALQETIRPGMTNHEIRNQWLELGREPGLWGATPNWPEPGRYYYGSTCHHIGLVSADPGPMIPGSIQSNTPEDSPPLVLERNMTFAVEVGCFNWDGARWSQDGVKIENAGLVTDDGFEIFYRFPYHELIACGLPGTY
jgi:Xaa-Pro dipeptidase